MSRPAVRNAVILFFATVLSPFPATVLGAPIIAIAFLYALGGKGSLLGFQVIYSLVFVAYHVIINTLLGSDWYKGHWFVAHLRESALLYLFAPFAFWYPEALLGVVPRFLTPGSPLQYLFFPYMFFGQIIVIGVAVNAAYLFLNRRTS